MTGDKRESGSAMIDMSRFRRNLDRTVTLAISRQYLELLARLGNPQDSLPAVVHVAGTNGKGSTCAFIRAACEAAGRRVHVYTSPHLVRFNERIRVAGQLISDDYLAELLDDCARLGDSAAISEFEAATVAAFKAFADNPADVAVIEVGLGGRLDATNVIERNKAAAVISRLSYDHCHYLGEKMAEIATEKAGIMRRGVPCFSAPQPSSEALDVLEFRAREIGCPLKVGGRDWRVETEADGDDADGGFRFVSGDSEISLPLPALVGKHQLWNAGLAVAALSALPFKVQPAAIRRAMAEVEWPARMQRLEFGDLAELLPSGWDLWLDGGHNDSAGEVIAAQMESWRRRDPSLGIGVVMGMLADKDAAAFLRPMSDHIDRMVVVDIRDEPLSQPKAKLAAIAAACGIENAQTAAGLSEALNILAQERPSFPFRVLICGSLYLAGQALKENG